MFVFTDGLEILISFLLIADLEEVEVVSTVVRRSKSPKGKAPKSLPPEIVVTERPSILMAQAITETCASLIKECADHPMEVFYWDHLYHINVPGKRFVDVTVHFAPPQPGEYKQTFVVTFHSVSRDILGEVTNPTFRFFNSLLITGRK